MRVSVKVVLIGLLESGASTRDAMDCQTRLQLVRKVVLFKLINPQ
jgi:hypothetical protein